MTKLRKVRRKKKFRYNVNRKRLRNKMNHCGKISCKEIADNWDKQKSLKVNLKEMGLSVDPNESVKIVNYHRNMEKAVIATNENEWFVEATEKPHEENDEKKNVVQRLLKEAKAPRVKCFRLPGSVVEWVTYLMDTYGDDYKAMTRDKRNIDQETPKQIQQKVKQFKSIEEQYSLYLKTKGLKNSI